MPNIIKKIKLSPTENGGGVFSIYDDRIDETISSVDTGKILTVNSDGKIKAEINQCVSPTVAISTITGGHRITITDADGAHTADVLDGAPGTDGADGADGYTPVRGTDYWTAADIATIKGYVDDAILGGAW